jgi:NAD(P) transhydrogenase subunit beta
LIGGGIAFWSGRKAKMTSMPQMVALYNGMGGGAAGAIAAVELFGNRAHGFSALIVTLVGALIGAVSLSGSLIAWAKLEGILKKPTRIPGQQFLNGAVLLATLALGGYMVFVSKGGETPLADAPRWIALFFGGALILGILMTLPIGGADMPVVISVYNACTGLAVGLEGFVLGNPALMIAGMVVGAAGTLLTVLMAKAMNRSVAAVSSANSDPPPGEEGEGAPPGSLKPVEASDAGIFMRYAKLGHRRPRVRSRRRASRAEALRVREASSGRRRRRQIRHSPGRGTHAGSDGRSARRGRGSLRPHLSARRHQRRVQGHGRRARHRRERCREPGGAHGQDVSHLRDADPQRRQSQEGLRHQARQGKGYAGIVNGLFYEDNCNMVYGDAQAVLVQMIEAVRGLGTHAAA